MKPDLSNHPIYICDECGNTTPIPDEVCSVCGGKMTSLDAEETAKEKTDGEGGAEESLEGLRDQEEAEAEDDYHKAFESNDDDE